MVKLVCNLIRVIRVHSFTFALKYFPQCNSMRMGGIGRIGANDEGAVGGYDWIGDVPWVPD